MISVNEGKVTVKGQATEILTDLAVAIESVVETLTEEIPREETLEMVEESYKLGTMTKEEQQEYMKARMKQIIDELFATEEEEEEQ